MQIESFVAKIPPKRLHQNSAPKRHLDYSPPHLDIFLVV